MRYVMLLGLLAALSATAAEKKLGYSECKAQGRTPADCRQYLSPEGQAQVDRIDQRGQASAESQRQALEASKPKKQPPAPKPSPSGAPGTPR